MYYLVSAGFCDKVAGQKVYLTPLPGEAANKCIREAFGTDRLFAATGFIEIDVGQLLRKSRQAKCL